MSRKWARSLVCSGLIWALGCGSDKDTRSDELTDEGPLGSLDGGFDAAIRDAARPRADADPNVDPNAGTCAAITKDAPVTKGKVDVIFVIDNSPSMVDDFLGITANLQGFFDTIEMSGADVRVVTVTIGDLAFGTALGGDAQKYRFVPWNVFSKLVYESALDMYGFYSDFLRPDAATEIVAITDDDDVIPAQWFVDAMKQNLGHDFTLHSIVADRLLCGSFYGAQYLAASDLTGGQKISICDGDYGAVFDTLTSAVVAAVPLPCSYSLAEAAANQSDFDPQEVAVKYTDGEGMNTRELPKSTASDKCGTNAGWYYDDANKPTKLELCPAACDLAKRGGQMSIVFGCPPRIFL